MEKKYHAFLYFFAFILVLSIAVLIGCVFYKIWESDWTTVSKVTATSLMTFVISLCVIGIGVQD